MSQGDEVKEEAGEIEERLNPPWLAGFGDGDESP